MDTPKANETTPNQKAWSDWLAEKLPTSAGSTGMISPMASMSISTVSMMNGIAASLERNALSIWNGVRASALALCRWMNGTLARRRDDGPKPEPS